MRSMRVVLVLVYFFVQGLCFDCHAASKSSAAADGHKKNRAVQLKKIKNDNFDMFGSVDLRYVHTHNRKGFDEGVYGRKNMFVVGGYGAMNFSLPIYNPAVSKVNVFGSVNSEYMLHGSIASIDTDGRVVGSSRGRNTGAAEDARSFARSVYGGVSVETAVGLFGVDNDYGPEKLLRVDIDDIARGVDQLSSHWCSLINLQGDNFTLDINGSTPKVGAQFHCAPELYGVGNANRMPLHFVYYTPFYNNYHIGASYSRKLDIDDHFNISLQDGYYGNVVSLGVMHESTMADYIKLSYSAAGEIDVNELFGSASSNDGASSQYYNLATWSFGMRADLLGASFVMSYGNLGKSGVAKQIPRLNLGAECLGVVAESVLPYVNIMPALGKTKTLFDEDYTEVTGSIDGDSAEGLFGQSLQDYYQIFDAVGDGASTNPMLANTDYFSTGLSYATERMGVSVVAMHSARMQNDTVGGLAYLNVASFGLEYYLSKNTQIHSSLTTFIMKDKTYISGSKVGYYDNGNRYILANPIQEINDVLRASVYGLDYADCKNGNCEIDLSKSMSKGEVYNSKNTPLNNRGFVWSFGYKRLF